MSDDQAKAELRQIEKELEKDEALSELKQKHGITGTREQQKEKVNEKQDQLENGNVINENETIEEDPEGV